MKRTRRKPHAVPHREPRRLRDRLMAGVITFAALGTVSYLLAVSGLLG